MYIVIKQKPDKSICQTYIFAEKELGKHITAQHELTDIKVIGVIYVADEDNKPSVEGKDSGD